MRGDDVTSVYTCANIAVCIWICFATSKSNFYNIYVICVWRKRRLRLARKVEIPLLRVSYHVVVHDDKERGFLMEFCGQAIVISLLFDEDTMIWVTSE